jgi:hypothetical protein
VQLRRRMKDRVRERLSRSRFQSKSGAAASTSVSTQRGRVGRRGTPAADAPQFGHPTGCRKHRRRQSGDAEVESSPSRCGPSPRPRTSTGHRCRARFLALYAARAARGSVFAARRPSRDAPAKFRAQLLLHPLRCRCLPTLTSGIRCRELQWRTARSLVYQLQAGSIPSLGVSAFLNLS